MIKEQVQQSVSVNKIGFKCPGPGQTPCPVAKYKLTEWGYSMSWGSVQQQQQHQQHGTARVRAVRVGFYCPAQRPNSICPAPPGVGCCCAVVLLWTGNWAQEGNRFEAFNVSSEQPRLQRRPRCNLTLSPAPGLTVMARTAEKIDW